MSRDATRRTVILDVLLQPVPCLPTVIPTESIEPLCTALLDAMTDPSVAWAFEQEDSGGPAQKKVSALDHLAVLLNAKEDELDRLRVQITELEKTLNTDQAWLRHRLVEDVQGLPVPRLEIEWVVLSEYRRVARYDLVKHCYTGGVIRVPLGHTAVSGYRLKTEPSPLDLPFRDGFHIQFDALQFGLPAFVRDAETGESRPIELSESVRQGWYKRSTENEATPAPTSDD